MLVSLRARYPDLPIIVLTGWYLDVDHEKEARALGATDYLLKPVDDSDLVKSLRNALARASSTRTPPPKNASAKQTGMAEIGGREHAAGESAFISYHLPRLVRIIGKAFPRVWDDVVTEQVEVTLLELLGKVNRGIWPVHEALTGISIERRGETCATKCRLRPGAASTKRGSRESGRPSLGQSHRSMSKGC